MHFKCLVYCLVEWGLSFFFHGIIVHVHHKFGCFYCSFANRNELKWNVLTA
uniref:Uncharacterized protein n=1 Tax=Arundo donax TaxID=35708 RepID=A0A0A8XTM0_ARUDO